MRQGLRVGILAVLGLVWLIPLYLFIVNAAKLPGEYGTATVWKLPESFGLFTNMGQAWDLSSLGDSLLSTTLYSLIGPALAAVIGAAAGYAIVTLRLRHGFVWFVLVFGGSIFPLQMVLMPLFDLYSRTGLYDTKIGMIVIYTTIATPFAAFVMRNFLGGVAHSVYEAGVVDGASAWQIFWRIYLPMSKSALVAIFILQATFIWNDLLLGLTLSQSDQVRPLVPALSALQSSYGGATMSVVLAGGLLVSLPTVLLFLCTQRFFARGLALGQY